MKFVDIKNDVAFRKIFGNQKKSVCLISFLNAVLHLEGYNRITKVTILDPYLLPRILGEKASIIDVRATDQKSRQFVVEMQVADKKGFEKRAQYYTARDYSMQIAKGEDYPKLKPTYFIGILNFGIGFGKQYLAEHFNVEAETGISVLDDIQYRFIQLTKFKKNKDQLVDMVDKWTYFIKHAEKLDVIPNGIEDEGLMVAYQEADKHSWKKEELIAYDNASMREQDERGREELAEERGKERGLEQGLERKEKETVIKLYLKGKTTADISDLLDIEIDRVQQIISEYEKNKK
jgi:predicted transposase/invertase (TIGR01784 family)